MFYSFKNLYAFGFLIALGTQMAVAQQSLIISDSLKSNAEVLKIKIGFAAPGKIPKFRFGDYSVVSSKQGWTTSSSKSNFLGTKTENSYSQKFSFALCDKENDTAKVNITNHITSKTSNSIVFDKHFSWGTDELLSGSAVFWASINISADTGITWSLVMKEDAGTQTNGKYEAFLTDGTRKLLIFSVSSDNNSKSIFSLPALGFEFIENNQSWCALQYRGGRAFGQNNVIIWLDKRLDPKLKLALSAAMIAILELKLSEQEGH